MQTSSALSFCKRNEYKLKPNVNQLSDTMQSNVNSRSCIVKRISRIRKTEENFIDAFLYFTFVMVAPIKINEK